MGLHMALCVVMLVLGVTASLADDLMLVARKTDLWWVNLTSPEEPVTRIPALGLRNAVAVDFDPLDEFVYWSDVATHSISRIRLDGSDQSVVHDVTTFTVDGLTVHWEARRLYWTDTLTDTLETSYLNGTGRHVVVSDDLDEPRTVVVYKELGMLYWTDWGAEPRIERCATDGSERETLVNTSLTWPNALTLDVKAGVMYWADAGTDLIEVADLDGSNRRNILSGVAHAFGIDKYGDYLYWSDWQHGNVQKIDIVTRDLATHTEVTSYMLHVMGVKAANVAGTSILFVAGRDQIREFNLSADPRDELGIGRKLPLTGLTNAITVDYNSVDNHIYWSDGTLQRINKAQRNGTGQVALVTTDIQTVDGLAISESLQQIFWTDVGLDRIQTCRTDGTNRQTLVDTGLDQPRAIALDDGDRMMYWTDWGAVAKIERASYDGSGREEIINTELLLPNGLALDLGSRKVYWADGQLGKIESSNLDGSGRVVLLGATIVRQAFGLSLLDGQLYWSEWTNHTIRRVDPLNLRDVSVIGQTRSSTFMGISITSTDVDRCLSSPCHNGGSCSSDHGRYSCVCPAGYYGDQCQQVDPCLSSPCHNGGTCTRDSNSYRCVCRSGYRGDQCEHDVQPVDTDPVIFAVSPLYGPQMGGTAVTVHGKHFTSPGAAVSIGDVTLTITESSGSRIEAVTPAAEASDVNKPLPVSITLPGYDVIRTPHSFTYLSNPTVSSVHPLTTIPQGGTTLTVNGTSFTSVAHPEMNMTVVIDRGDVTSEDKQTKEMNSTTNMYYTNCTTQSAETLHCVTPDLKLPPGVKYNTQTCADGDDGCHGDGSDITLYIGIILDGVPDYRNLSQNEQLSEYGMITVTSAPSFDGGQNFEYNGDPISIKGENLARCCSRDDLLVDIGSALCTIIDMEELTVTCMPPAKHDINGSLGDGGKMAIKVHVGTNLQFVVGHIKYSDLPSWLIPVVAVTAVVVVILVVAVVLCVKRKDILPKKDASLVDPRRPSSTFELPAVTTDPEVDSDFRTDTGEREPQGEARDPREEAPGVQPQNEYEVIAENPYERPIVANNPYEQPLPPWMTLQGYSMINTTFTGPTPAGTTTAGTVNYGFYN